MVKKFLRPLHVVMPERKNHGWLDNTFRKMEMIFKKWSKISVFSLVLCLFGQTFATDFDLMEDNLTESIMCKPARANGDAYRQWHETDRELERQANETNRQAYLAGRQGTAVTRSGFAGLVFFVKLAGTCAAFKATESLGGQRHCQNGFDVNDECGFAQFYAGTALVITTAATISNCITSCCRTKPTTPRSCILNTTLDAMSATFISGAYAMILNNAVSECPSAQPFDDDGTMGCILLSSSEKAGCQTLLIFSGILNILSLFRTLYSCAR